MALEALSAGQHPLACPRTANIDARIIGVAYEAMTPSLQLAVEFIQEDVRQQRRERAALRRPFLPLADDTARHDTGFEVATDQPEHALVFDTALDAGHQDIVVDPIEELLQVEFHAPAIPRRHMRAGHLDSLVSASARTEAVAVVRKQRIEEWCELLLQCLLDQAIHDAGDAQLPRAALRLGNFNRSYCLGIVFTGQQPGL